MRLAHAEVEWFSSLSYHPATAPTDQDHRCFGTRLCGRSRERAGSRRGRVSAEADYMGSLAGVNRSTSTGDSASARGDEAIGGLGFGTAAIEVVGCARFAPSARAGD